MVLEESCSLFLSQSTEQNGNVFWCVFSWFDGYVVCVIPVRYRVVIVVIYSANRTPRFSTSIVYMFSLPSSLPRVFRISHPTEKSAFGIDQLIPAVWALIEIERYHGSWW